MFKIIFNAKALVALVMALGVGVATAAPFVISSNGQEVTDSSSGLVWRRCPEGMVWSGGECTGKYGTYTHETALQVASRVQSSSGVAWRLPNVKELASIIDRTKYSPAVDRAVFINIPSVWFWTSTPSMTNSSAAFMVDFNAGLIGSRERSVLNPIWLVR